MSQRVTLDDTAMRARLRSHGHAARPTVFTQRPAAQPSRQLFQDVVSLYAQPAMVAPEPIVSTTPQLQTSQASAPTERLTPQPQTSSIEAQFAPAPPVIRQFTPVVAHKPERSHVLMRQSVPVVKKRKLPKVHMAKPSRANMLTAMAVVVFVVGLSVSLMGFHTNNVAQAEVAKINKKVATGAPTTTDATEKTPPSTTPVTGSTLASYQVAADMARYIRIPKIGVFARVLQVGVTKDGALATPTNVFDTAWYNGSAKPGQPGATLIDGHVSSWTTNGVFYSIKTLIAGDTIEIEKGDGTKLEYTVAKTTAYDAASVDMGALMTPVTTGKSGLNLITCGGKYDSKSGEFTQRIAVFATLNQ